MIGTLYFDGGGQAPGPICGAVVIERPGQETFESSFVLPEGTNNVAEYMALRHGLTIAVAMGITDLKVYGDSKLIVEQVNGRWKCKHEVLRPLLADCQRQLAQLRTWSLEHVRREHNKRADKIGRERMATHG